MVFDEHMMHPFMALVQAEQEPDDKKKPVLQCRH